MHRWNADTVGNLRIEYLHIMQTVYEHEIVTCQDMIDHGTGREVAIATKRKETHTSQPENKQQAAIFLGPCRADHARAGSGF